MLLSLGLRPSLPPNGTLSRYQLQTSPGGTNDRWWIIDYWTSLQGTFSGYSTSFTAVSNTIEGWASNEAILILPINIAYGSSSSNCVWFQFSIQFNSPPYVPVQWNIQNNNCPATSPSDYHITNIPVSYVVGHSYVASMSPSSISPPQATFSITDTTSGSTWSMTYAVPSTSIVYDYSMFSPASAVEGVPYRPSPSYTNVPYFQFTVQHGHTSVAHYTAASTGYSVPTTVNTRTARTANQGVWHWSMTGTTTPYVLHLQSSPITGVLISLGSPPTPYMNTDFDITSPNSFMSGPFTAASSVTVGGSSYLFDHWELDGVNKGANPLSTVYVGSGYPSERTAVAVYALRVVVTATSASTVTSTSYLSMTTNKTSTSYTSTTTTTSTIPTVTTVVLVPLTITSTDQGTQFLTSVLTTTTTSYTSTTTSTSTIPTTVALVASTVTSIVQSIQYLTSILSSTVTNYIGTQTSTSTVVVPTTVVLVPSTVTSTALSTQFLTSTSVTTVTNYTSTETSTSTILVPTTIVLVPLTATSTIESTQYLTSTSTTTVTNYTNTTTSTSTSVVYTTVTVSQGGAGADASSPLAYLGFMSVLAIMASHGVTAGRSWRRLQDRHLANITKGI